MTIVERASAASGQARANGTLISVDRLDKTYISRERTEVEALADVGFHIAPGEFVSLVGPSGCGKSTLLRILGGLIPPTSGSVLFRGEPVVHHKKDIGIVFQNAVLLPWRTVLQNIMLPVIVRHLDRAVHHRKAFELLAMTGLEGFVNKYPNELSGGMQQRVSIARALVYDPSILLMDEPFGALDAMTREHMNVELLRIWRESRKTVFFITHSIPEAVFLSDRVLAMSPRPGRIVREVRIGLPRPRELEMMVTKEFGDHLRDIRSFFDVRGRFGD